MKLILAIVNIDDGANVTSALTREGFFVTTLSTTGGFLMAGNRTLLIGTDDGKVDRIKEILSMYCSSKLQKAPRLGDAASLENISEEVTVGGATYFVLDVNEFGKV